MLFDWWCWFDCFICCNWFGWFYCFDCFCGLQLNWVWLIWLILCLLLLVGLNLLCILSLVVCWCVVFELICLIILVVCLIVWWCFEFWLVWLWFVDGLVWVLCCCNWFDLCLRVQICELINYWFEVCWFFMWILLVYGFCLFVFIIVLRLVLRWFLTCFPGWFGLICLLVGLLLIVDAFIWLGWVLLVCVVVLRLPILYLCGFNWFNIF